MKTISSDVTSSPGLLQARNTHFHGMPDMAGIVNVDNVALRLRAIASCLCGSCI